MQKLALTIAVIALSASAFAAGLDSRSTSCAALQQLIAARGFVFISQPFGDFVVASRLDCGPGEVVVLRSLPTADQPECLVNHCQPCMRPNCD